MIPARSCCSAPINCEHALDCSMRPPSPVPGVFFEAQRTENGEMLPRTLGYQWRRDWRRYGWVLFPA